MTASAIAGPTNGLHHVTGITGDVQAKGIIRPSVMRPEEKTLLNPGYVWNGLSVIAYPLLAAIGKAMAA